MVSLLKISKDLQLLFADVGHLYEGLSLQSLLTRYNNSLICLAGARKATVKIIITIIITLLITIMISIKPSTSSLCDRK
jgi:hypothetical protein